MKKLKLTDNQIIDLLGGTNKVARLCQVAPAAVSQWRNNNIPADKFIFLGAELERQSFGLVSRKDLFPNHWWYIWPELLPQSER